VQATKTMPDGGALSFRSQFAFQRTSFPIDGQLRCAGEFLRSEYVDGVAPLAPYPDVFGTFAA
jgi:hypothetical protein